MATYRSFEKSGLIGLSLSLCIAEMVRDHISKEDVVKIVAATSFSNLEEFESNVVPHYNRCHWHGIEQEAHDLAIAMYNDGKIEQPRLEGKPVHAIYDGKWVDSESDMIEW